MQQAIADHVGARTSQPMAVIDSVGPVAIPLMLLAIVVLVAIWQYRQHKALKEAHRQACSDYGLIATDTPVGLDDAALVRFDLLPRGDRRYSTAWGLQGSAALRLGGAPVAVQCASFQWWWEDRRTETDSKGHTTTRYVRMSLFAGLVRLPPPYAMPSVRVKREGMFARMGVGGRGDFQVESEEFNRRHDVRVGDRATAIRLFDPAFQQQMLGPLHNATFELVGDLALLVTSGPSYGVKLVQALLGVGREALDLLEAMPEGWWRAVSQRTT